MPAVAMPQLRRHLFLPAAVAALVALAAPGAASAKVCHHTKADPNDISLGDAKDATLCLLNDIRRDHGLRKFRENPRLSLASQRHTNSMTARNFFEHGDFVGRIRSANYLRGARGWTVGENIAWGSWDYATPKSIVRGWMHSSGHRHNILNRRFREIGIGVARGAPIAGVDHAATYATSFGTRF